MIITQATTKNGYFWLYWTGKTYRVAGNVGYGIFGFEILTDDKKMAVESFNKYIKMLGGK